MPDSERQRLRLGALLVSIAVCLGVGALGAATTATSVGTWYPRIEKPAWTPPAAVFAPVWTILYLMMAFSAWSIWRADAPPVQRRRALFAFFVQLGLNALWSHLFFGLRDPGLALAEIVLLWISILVTLLLFRRVSTAAAWLLAPYLAWVSFALALNAAIWSLNPG